jgi:hypothetical protein
MAGSFVFVRVARRVVVSIPMEYRKPMGLKTTGLDLEGGAVEYDAYHDQVRG